MRFTSGKTFDKSKLVVDYKAQPDSKNEVELGDQLDQSERYITITELPPDFDLALLSTDLSKLSAAMTVSDQAGDRKDETHAIEEASKAAAKGDRALASQFLIKSGKWALDTATKIGVSLAAEALKHVLQLS